jgi:hypothetical protein
VGAWSTLVSLVTGWLLNHPPLPPMAMTAVSIWHAYQVIQLQQLRDECTALKRQLEQRIQENAGLKSRALKGADGVGPKGSLEHTLVASLQTSITSPPSSLQQAKRRLRS